MNISYILCLFLAVFSSACDDDKTDENNAKQVTVTISPSDKVIVEGEGGDISFTVTPSDPAVELRYVSSVEWMKAAAGGGASWSVAANSSDGFIYRSGCAGFCSFCRKLVCDLSERFYLYRQLYRKV